MAVDYEKPVNTTSYLTLLAQLRENIVECLKWSGAGAGVPDGAMRFNDAENRFEKKTAGAWGALRTLAQTFAMKVHDSAHLNGQSAAFYRNAGNLNAGTLPVARLPNHSAAKITSGTLTAARLPDFDAAKITTGAFDAARIPVMDAGKIGAGVLDAARIPDTRAVRGLNAVNVRRVVNGAGAHVTDAALSVAVNGREMTVTLTLTKAA